MKQAQGSHKPDLYNSFLVNIHRVARLHKVCMGFVQMHVFVHFIVQLTLYLSVRENGQVKFYWWFFNFLTLISETRLRRQGNCYRYVVRGRVTLGFATHF